MKSYIAIALILCLAVMQVSSQGQQKSTGAPQNPQNARAAAAVARAANLAMLSGAAKSASGSGGMGGLMGRGFWPLMMTQGNDMMQNYFLFRMLSGGASGSGSGSSSMSGLEPLLYGSMFGGLDLGM